MQQYQTTCQTSSYTLVCTLLDCTNTQQEQLLWGFSCPSYAVNGVQWIHRLASPLCVVPPCAVLLLLPAPVPQSSLAVPSAALPRTGWAPTHLPAAQGCSSSSSSRASLLQPADCKRAWKNVTDLIRYIQHGQCCHNWWRQCSSHCKRVCVPHLVLYASSSSSLTYSLPSSPNTGSHTE